MNPLGRRPSLRRRHLMRLPRRPHSRTRGPSRTAPRPRKPLVLPSARPRASRGGPALPHWPPCHRRPPCGLSRPRSPRTPQCRHCQYLLHPSSSAAPIRPPQEPRTRPARQTPPRLRRPRRRPRPRSLRLVPLPPHSLLDAQSCWPLLPPAPKVPNGPGRVHAFHPPRKASGVARTALGGRSPDGWSFEEACEAYGPRPSPPCLAQPPRHCARRHRLRIARSRGTRRPRVPQRLMYAPQAAAPRGRRPPRGAQSLK